MNLNFQATTVAPHGAVIDLPAVGAGSVVTVQQIVTKFEGADPFTIDWRAELLIDDRTFIRSQKGRFDGKQWNFVFTGTEIPAQCYGIRYVVRSSNDTWIPVQFGE